MKKITIFLFFFAICSSYSQTYGNFNASKLYVPAANDCSVAAETTTIDTDNNIVEIKTALKESAEFNLNFLFKGTDGKNKKVSGTAQPDDIVKLNNTDGFSITGMCTRTGDKDTEGNNIDLHYGDFCSHTGAKVVTTFSFSAFADDNSLEQASTTIDINPNGVLGDPTKYLSSTWTINVVYDASLSFKKLDYYGFTFSPNPAGNTLNLSANDNISKIEIYNTLGQSALRQTVDAMNTSLDISNFKKGIYLMKASINNKTATYRIVKE